jgi:dephospho-CoA kinase
VKVIGLTGGIAMGKSTAAAAFRRARLPVFDADAEVHRLQARGGAALPAIAVAFPGTVSRGDDGRLVLDRAALREAVLGDAAALDRLEAILHPMVRAAERRFLAAARRRGAHAAVLDIPLLFERRGRDGMDLVVTVSAPAAVQAARVRRRGTLSPRQFAAVLGRQLPDRERRRRADVVVHTGLSRHHANRVLTRATRSFLA